MLVLEVHGRQKFCIACYDTWKAPADCLQYFTGPVNDITSFNWGNGIVQLQSLDYTICIRKEYGYCSIEYAPAQGLTPDSWAPSDDATVLLGSDAFAKEAYVNIAGAPAISSPLFTGTKLSIVAADNTDSTVLATGGRFLLGVYTTATSQASNGGFVARYVQKPC